MSELTTIINAELEERRTAIARLGQEVDVLEGMRDAAQLLERKDLSMVAAPPPSTVAEPTMREVIAAEPEQPAVAPAPLPQSPPPRPSAGERRPRRSTVEQHEFERKIMSTLINNPNGVSKAIIVQKAGRTPDAVRTVLSRLVNDGKVERVGATNSLRYKLIARAKTPGSISEKVENGRIRNQNDEQHRTDQIVVRDKVLKAIAADEDALTDQRLAQALSISQDQVVDATQKLLADGRVILHADETYSLASNGRTAVIA